MSYKVLLRNEYELDRPSWHPEESERRRILEFNRYFSMTHSRANVWWYPPGTKGTPHEEPVQQEIFYVIDGTLTMELGDDRQKHELPAGSVVVIEPGTHMHVMNESDDNVMIFVYGAPIEEEVTEHGMDE